MAASIPGQAKPRAPALPIDGLKTNTARLYTHVHPVLLASLYAYRFPAMVADPVATLSSSLLPLSILQIAYVTLCLPPTGGSATAAVQIDKRKSGEKRKVVLGRAEGGIGGKLVPAFLSLLLSALAAAPLLTATLVLFGAPVTTHHSHTLLCGAHIALLSVLPLVYVHGVDGGKWREIVALLLPVDEVYGSVIGTMVGAWLGAIPIPLDWDREWQKWPVTIVTGAYIGYAVGKFLGGTVFKGKKVLL